MVKRPPLYPLLLEPVLHVHVWGGHKLADVMNKKLPTGDPYGESWEVYDTSKIVNGVLAGQTLGETLAEYGTTLIGPDNDPRQGFPLLVKFLDAAEWLSVQVHPNDEQAARLEGEPRGKNEAWYILAAAPGAQLVIGVKPGTSRDEMIRAIQENRLEELLVYADIVTGDTLYIPAGTIHSIGPGALIYEVQQTSDMTYRLYDWGRMGLDGQPRRLHIEKGAQVANLDSLPEIVHLGNNQAPEVAIVTSDFFTTRLHHIDSNTGGVTRLDTTGRRFHTLTCIDGEVQVTAAKTTILMTIGQSAVIPASTGDYHLSGKGTLLRSWQTATLTKPA